jgi:hypothetical protein
VDKEGVWKRLFSELGKTLHTGLSAKISLAVDALGNLVRFVPTAGQSADFCQRA